jgi:hypothetical protein
LKFKMESETLFLLCCCCDGLLRSMVGQAILDWGLITRGGQ